VTKAFVHQEITG